MADLSKNLGEDIENITDKTAREIFKDEVRSILNDDETMAVGEPEEIIYKIDDLKVYGGFEMGVRGVDHNILIDNETSWEDIIEYGTVVVPENKTYISNKSIKEFKDLGYSNLPTNNNHIIKKGNTKNIEEEFTNDELAEEIGFFSDKKGVNHFRKEKRKVFKATKLKTETKKNYQNHIVRLESEDENVFTENIVTPQLKNKDIKKWKNGMTGEEWLNENLLSEVPKNNIDVTPRIYDNRLMKNELDDIQDHIKTDKISQTR